MSEWKWRLAKPADAPAFSKWAAENPQIEPNDLLLGMKKNNPTVMFFVAEKDGVPIVFAPVYCSMVVAHLGLNPDARASDLMKGLEVLMDGTMAFAVQFGIREITTLSKEEYGVAKWATRHGFVKDERQLFKLDINRILAEATSGAESAIQEATTICAPEVKA